MRRRFVAWLRRPSVLVLLGVLVLAIALRIALPSIVRSVAVDQADQALVGRITLEDVDFALLRGGVALHGVTVYADELAPQAEVGADATDVRDAAAAPATSEPVANIGRLWVRIGWLPLLRKTIDVAEVELDDFTVRLDRARDGALVLPRPVPSDEPEAEEPPPAEEGSGWGLRISQVRLRNGRLGFRDFAADPEPEPFELAIDDVTAGNLVLTVAGEGHEPGHLTLEARIGEGSLALDSRVAMRDAGPHVESTITLRDLPVDGTQVYLKDLGWSDISGRLDAELQHVFDAEGPHTASGTVALRDLEIDVPENDGPALAWSRLDVTLGEVDVVGQKAEVSRVALDGLRLPLRPNEPERAVPLLHALLAKDASGQEATASTAQDDATPAPGDAPAAREDAPAAAEEVVPADAGSANGASTDDAVADAADANAASSSNGAPSDAAADGAAPPEPAANEPALRDAASETPAAERPASGEAPADDASWTWRVAEVELRDATIELVRGEATVPLALEATLQELSSDASARSEVSVKVAPPAGTIEVAGGVVQQPLAFDGTVRVAQLALPELLAAIEQPVLALLRSGVLDADLTVALGPPSGAGDQAARVSGKVALANLEVADPQSAGDAFGVAWKNVTLEISEGVVPAALGGESNEPIRATLASLEVVEPAVRVTRTERGIVLPAALGGSDAASSAPEGDAAGSSEAKQPPEPAAARAAEARDAAASEPPAPVDLRIARATIARGRINVEDRAVRPPFRNEILPLDVRATGVRWPGPVIEDLKLDAKTKQGAKLNLTGSVRGNATNLTAKLDDLPLEPLNPYASGTGYGLGGGTVSLESKVKMTGDAFDASNRLVLSQLTITGEQGEALFQQQFGIPLSLALALLTDLDGKISLDIPVAGDRSGASVALGSIIGQALTKAILGAVTSPLKLVMAIGTAGGKVENATPQAIAFRPGRAELTENGEELVERLAELLERSPALRIELRGRAGAEDERWLREQALREEIEQSSGFWGTIANVGELDQREAVLPVLQKRANDEPADVPEEAREWFEERLAEQDVPPSRIPELAAERARAVQAALVEKHGIATERVALAEVDASPSGQQAPEVALELGAGPAASASLASSTTAAPAP